MLEPSSVLLVKQPLAIIKIKEAAIQGVSEEKIKVKQWVKPTEIKFAGCRLLVMEWDKIRDYYYMKS